MPIRQRVALLRKKGYTYPEINAALGLSIPKGTLSYMCRNVVLGTAERARIKEITREQLLINQKKAVAANKQLLANKIATLHTANQNLKPFLHDRRAKLIALAMLYLGEGAKWKGRRGLMLGSASPQILRLYIGLLRDCYDIPVANLRCRIQHRADQDPSVLLAFWSSELSVPLANFYPCYADKRTAGQTTKHPHYMGVCTVTCAGTHIQLELEQIAGIIEEVFEGI